MQNANDNIDLDALFDMLNIDAVQSNKSSVTSSTTAIAQADANSVEIPELSPLDGDLFLFDTPTDQS